MTFVPAVNVYEAVIKQRLHGQSVLNVINIHVPGGPANDQTMAAQIGLIVGAEWPTALYPYLSVDLSMQSIDVRYLGVQDGVTTVNVQTATGVVSNPGLPGSVALCVSLKTGYAGRSRRGRWYLAGLCENQVTGNQITETLRGQVENAAQDFIDAVTTVSAGSLIPVVLSRVNQGVPRTAALVTPITSTVVADTNVDSQRRRLTARGV